MGFGLTLATAPAAEPVSLTEAKLHCRVDTDDEDDLLTMLVAAARQYVERLTGRALITQTWRLTLDCFPYGCRPVIRLPRGKTSSVTSITYVDTEGTTTTLAADQYRVNMDGEPARIEPAYGVVWPTTRDVLEAVKVTYVAGYGAAGSAVPEALRQAMLLLVGHWYANREAVVTGTIATPLQLTVEALTAAYWTGEYF